MDVAPATDSDAVLFADAAARAARTEARKAEIAAEDARIEEEQRINGDMLVLPDLVDVYR